MTDAQENGFVRVEKRAALERLVAAYEREANIRTLAISDLQNRPTDLSGNNRAFLLMSEQSTLNRLRNSRDLLRGVLEGHAPMPVFQILKDEKDQIRHVFTLAHADNILPMRVECEGQAVDFTDYNLLRDQAVGHKITHYGPHDQYLGSDEVLDIY